MSGQNLLGYSAKELSILAKFRTVCERILECRFMRELPNTDHRIRWQAGHDGESKLTFPLYDEDDFLAFLTHFRKLVAQNESTNLNQILILIGKYSTDEERQALKGIRKMLESEATSPPLRIAIGAEGNETPYSPRQIENIIFNGKVFHTDDALQDDLRRLIDFDPFTKATFLRYATIVVRQSRQTVGVLKHRGIV